MTDIQSYRQQIGYFNQCFQYNNVVLKKMVGYLPVIILDSSEYLPMELDLRLSKYIPLKRRRPALKKKNKKSCIKNPWAKLSLLSFMFS